VVGRPSTRYEERLDDRLRLGEDPQLAALHGKIDKQAAKDREAIEAMIDRLLDE